jgi:4-hydroxybenzoate polyprenyltransferase
MTADPVGGDPGGLGQRLWVYQRERFPLASQGVLIVGLALSATAFAAAGGWPRPGAVAAAAVVLFALFALLRIADEHKDAEDDRRFRPYRAVPRGLVTLALLRRIGAGLALAAVVAAALVGGWPLVALLAGVFGWYALMSAEFFAPAWLKARPLVYLASHMVIMPLIGWLALACQWTAAGLGPAGGDPGRLAGFLAALFVLGLVLEVGRKIRVPGQEEVGVETYSRLYGPAAASLGWLLLHPVLWAAVAWALHAPGPPVWSVAVPGAAGTGAAVWARRRYLRAAEGAAEPGRGGRMVEATSLLAAGAALIALGAGPALGGGTP